MCQTLGHHHFMGQPGPTSKLAATSNSDGFKAGLIFDLECQTYHLNL